MKPHWSHAVETPFFQVLKIIHFCTDVRVQGCGFMCASYSTVIEWVVTLPQVKQYGFFFNEGNNVKVGFLLCARLNSV